MTIFFTISHNKFVKETDCFSLQLHRLLTFCKPSLTGITKMCTRRKSNNHIHLPLTVCTLPSQVLNSQLPLSNGITSCCICHSGCPPEHSITSQLNALCPFSRKPYTLVDFLHMLLICSLLNLISPTIPTV